MQNEPPSATPTGSMTLPLQGLRLLVVDDDMLVREIFSSYLREDKHIVETAEDGREGLEKFNSGDYQLVLTDRAMPEMNGDQLAQEIKKINPKMPVILLTGFGDGQGTESCPGVDIILTKPFKLDTLRAAIFKVMQGSGAAG